MLTELVFAVDAGVIVGVLGIVVAIVTASLSVYLYYRRQKVLTYAIVTSQRFTVSKVRKPQELKVVYGEEAVDDVHLVGVVITNTGTSDIEPTDFRDGLLCLQPRQADRSDAASEPADANGESQPPALIIGAEAVSESSEWQEYVGVEEGKAIVQPCYIERTALRRQVPLAIQLVLIHYNGEGLDLHGRLRNGKIRGRVLQNQDKIRLWTAIGGIAVAIVGLVVADIVQPKGHHGTYHHPWQTIVAIWVYTSLAVVIVALILQVVSGLRYRRRQRLFE